MKPHPVRPEAAIHDAAERLETPLLPDQAARLLQLAELLELRAVALGLVATGDRGRILDRHVVDSLRATPHVAGAETTVDIGSGAGLPGLVLAITLPAVRVVLLDARRRAVAFLELACERLELRNAEPRHARVEALHGLEVEACTARAFGSLARSWEAARPLLARPGRLVYFSGPVRGDIATPVDAGSAQVVPSPLVDSSGPLVIIKRT